MKIEANKISVDYDSRQAVVNVSLSIARDEILAIIGPNGAGKSSLLRALNGGVSVSSGEVLLDGKPVRAFARRVIARRIAVVAQEADLRFPLTVLEYVLGGRYAWASGATIGWESDRDLAIAEQAVAQTELVGFESRLMNELSDGERQRAVLARALATEAQILLLDEPTANLDLAHQEAMLRLIRTYCDSKRAAAVVVTHDLNLAAEFADRVMLLKNGRAIAIGSPHEVLNESLLQQIFGLRVLVDAHPVSGAPRITPIHNL